MLSRLLLSSPILSRASLASSLASRTLSSLQCSTSQGGAVKTGQLASLLSASVFKRAFGKHKDNLLAFLNDMYDEEKDKIVSIDNVEQSSVASKAMVFDILCTLSTGRRIIVELQQADVKRSEIAKRLICYLSRSYSEQWEKRMSKGYALIPVRVLALFAFQIDKSREKSGDFIQRYNLRIDGGDVPALDVISELRELMDVMLVQLSLAPNRLSECSKPSEKWGRLLFDSSRSKTIDEIDPGFFTDKHMAKVIECAQIDKMTKAQLRGLARDEKLEKDRQQSHIATIEAAENERDDALRQVDVAKKIAEQEMEAKEAALRRIAELEEQLKKEPEVK